MAYSVLVALGSILEPPGILGINLNAKNPERYLHRIPYFHTGDRVAVYLEPFLPVARFEI